MAEVMHCGSCYCSSSLRRSPNFICLLGCRPMTHVAPSDSCFLAPDINTVTYLNCRVLDKILDSVLEAKKARFAHPYFSEGAPASIAVGLPAELQ